ncbi:MAG: signal peptide peptidase SppA [Bacteroidales bacterium]
MKQFFKFAFASCLGFGISVVVLGYLLIFGLTGLVASMGNSKKSIESNSILHLKLSGSLVDRAQDNPLNTMFSDYDVTQTGLDQVLKAIENAKNSPKIEGIFLEPGMIQAGLPSISEIRRKLEDFKSSGKFVYAYSDYYGQSGYYLASVADSIFVNPVGAVDFKGISANLMFFKGALDKLGVDMQIFKVGTFKSAVEPFIETKMSEPNRQQVTEYVSSIWGSLLGEISSARKISVKSLQEVANEGIFAKEPQLLVSNKLVDRLNYREEFEQMLRDKVGAISRKELKLVKIADLANETIESKTSKTKDAIALVYAVGEIDGTSKDRVDTKKLAAEIYKIKADSSVKAVVLRVNSPGGSAFGSEQVWKALDDLKMDKPFVVSMGDLAASGGYYIACGADWIIAEPTTLTGSIGIFGMIPNTKGLTDKLGLTFDKVETNRFASMPSIHNAMSEDEKRLIQLNVERGYELFTRRCAEGRNMPIDSLLMIAEGRVWTGERALGLSLVDELGGMDAAISKAASLAALQDYKVDEYPLKKDFMTSLIEDFGGSAVETLGSIVIGENYKYYSLLNSIKGMEPVQARLPFFLTIE